MSSARPVKEIRRADEDGVCTILDNQWENPASLYAIQDAIANYGVLLHHLWPLDMSFHIMNKVLVKYRWVALADSMKTRVEVISQFFNSVLRANSRRAANKEAVLSFSEQETIMKSSMTKNGLTPEFVIQGQPNRRNENGKGQKPAQSQTQRPRNSPLYFNNTKVCSIFNSTDGRDCRSTPTPTGCKARDGTEYAHVCNRFLPDKKRHCFLTHRRKDHK